MDTTHHTARWSRRQLTVMACLIAATGAVGGGAGGYLLDRATAGSQAAPALTLPAAAPDAAAVRRGLATDGRAGTPVRVPNADSQSGYGTGFPDVTPVRVPNADSQSGY